MPSFPEVSWSPALASKDEEFLYVHRRPLIDGRPWVIQASGSAPHLNSILCFKDFEMGLDLEVSHQNADLVGGWC